MRLLGLDYGQKRIGVALSDPMRLTAQPFDTIIRDKKTVGTIEKIVSENEVTEIVLGYPVTVDALRVFLSDKIAINQQEIAVYNEYDPRDAYTDEAIALQAGKDEDYVPALGSEYPADEKPAYGKDYNEKFLKELEDVRKERVVVEVENPLMQKTTVDNTSVAPRDVGEAGGYSPLGGTGTDGPQK